MALRSGYKGFKKLKSPLILNRPGTIEIDGDALNAELNEVFFPRSEQAVLGAKNLWPKYVGISATPQNVTFTADSEGVVSCEGTSSAVATWRQGNLTLKAGKYKLYGGEGIGTYNSSSYNALVGLYNPSTSAYIAPDAGTTDTYTFEADTVVQPTLKIQTGVDSSNYTFKPMIYFADDPDSTFVPYAMTNKGLTDEVETLNGSASDQKTAINAIIAAATGAADFAAFKAAMEAITTVTRSLSIQAPETREASAPAERTIEDEPVTVKKTTRKKSTATAETEKEGE